MTMTNDEFREHLESGFKDTNAHDIERMQVDQLDWYMWAQSDKNQVTAQTIELRKVVDAELKAETYENKVVAFNKQVINGTAYGIIATVIMLYGYMMWFTLGSIFAYHPQAYPLRGEYEYATEFTSVDPTPIHVGTDTLDVELFLAERVIEELQCPRLDDISWISLINNVYKTAFTTGFPTPLELISERFSSDMYIFGDYVRNGISDHPMYESVLPTVKVIDCIAGLTGFPLMDYHAIMGGASNYKTFMSRFQCRIQN